MESLMFINPLPPEIVDELRAVLAKACVRLEAIENPGPELQELKTVLLEALLAALRAEADAAPATVVLH
jgi:hypothetical protein